MFRDSSYTAAPSRHDPPTLAPGAIVGGYTVDQRIGAGGVAEVYAAAEPHTARGVALKVLRPKYHALSDFVERMRREGAVTSELHHPNIVRCWATGIDDGRPWLALERLHGATLRQLLKLGRPLWPHDVLSAIRQGALGLGAAHRRGIVHRDLKPENLFIERQRSVLLDFGFANASHHSPLTNPFVTPGTMAYMAPEQILRKPPNPRMDIYALGTCMYEALVGRHPFVNRQGEWPSDDVMARFHLDDPPCPLTELFEGFPSTIWSIVEKCLQKDPSLRYVDAEDLAADLRDRERRLMIEFPRRHFQNLSELLRAWGQPVSSKPANCDQAYRSMASSSEAQGNSQRARAVANQLLDSNEGRCPTTPNREWPIVHVGLNGTAAWAEVSGVCIYVGAKRPPLNADWNAYLEWLAPRCQPGTTVRTLVVEQGDGPNAAQRIRLGEITSKCSGRVAVVTSSAVIRGVVTALNWLKAGSYRAFSREELDSAVAHLGATAGPINQAARTLVNLLAK